MSKRWPYVILLPLVATALFYQLFYTFEVFNVSRPGHSVYVPVVTGDDFKIEAVAPDAAKAGVHQGDILGSIDGKRPAGGRDFFRALHKRGSETPLVLELLSKDSGKRRTVLLSAKLEKSPDLSDIFVSGTFAAVMLLCIVVGSYPVLVRPSDAKAWIFFAMMAATAQVIRSAQWYDFPRPFQFFAYLFPSLASFSAGLWLFLFGLYFPDRFEWDKKRPWIKWIVLAPAIAIHLVLAAAVADWYFDFDRMNSVLDFIHIHGTGPFAGFGFIFFFVCLFTRLAITRNRDARRRLRILLAGCIVSLVPLCAFVIYQAFVLKNSLERSSNAFLITACFLFCLFPFILAYAIVAERAMDLRMVIRQGLRYTLAKAGLRVLFALFLTAIIWPSSGFLFNSKFTGLDSNTESSLKIAFFIGFVIAIVSLARRARERVARWIDKRFFREAYNSEMLLEELSESVGSMLIEEEMLRTVAHRISESLHVAQFAFLLKADGAYHPVYCLGLDIPAHTSLPNDSKTLEIVKNAKAPAPIYFDHKENWIYSAPDAELSTLKSLHSQLLLPVRSRKELLGVISVGPKRSEAPYSGSDVQLLRSVAAQTGLALENSRLTKAVASEVAQRERLNREIEIARAVQERLFPQRLPPIAGIDYFGACRPALGVGGDYYDFLKLANGDLGVAIGDVSGKGIAAALLMASLQASLRGQALVGQADLAQLMTNVNQLVYEASEINRYATFFYGQFHSSSGLFRYVNAGHNPPFIVRRSHGAARIIRLETGGPPVGLIPGVPYQEGSLYLEPGDIFVGFTDGISETMNNEEEEWGEARFIPAATEYGNELAANLIPKLMAAADCFAAGAPQHDDMTLVVMKLCSLTN